MKNIILIGDSIRGGYQPFVVRELENEATVWGSEENGGTSINVLAHLDEWVFSRPSDIVHVNCGLHDIVREPQENGDGRNFRVPLYVYEHNVHEILRRIQSAGKTVIWATTTPVREPTNGFLRREADVDLYNAAALRVAQALKVPVNDLNRLVHEVGRDQLLLPDGVHFSAEGSEVLGNAVATCLRLSL